jgi:hypothetical protein
MGAGATILAILTVLVGMAALAHVSTPHASRPLRRLIAGHLSLAFAGVVLLLVAVVGASGGIAWASFAVLMCTGLVGLGVLLRARREAPGVGSMLESGQLLEEGRVDSPVPVPVVVLHGAAAILTLLLVVLTALTVAKA